MTGGASTTSIENNVLWGDVGSLPELLVDKSSAPGTTEGYNVAATTDLLTADDPAVGSANSAALGLPATDFYGNPWTDDTAVASTGSGPETYCDRGAVNLAEYTGATVNAAVDEQSVAVTVELSGLLLGSTGSISLNWGDGSSSDAVLPSNSSGTVFTDYGHNFALHQYTSAGTYTVTATIVDASRQRTAGRVSRAQPADRLEHQLLRGRDDPLDGDGLQRRQRFPVALQRVQGHHAGDRRRVRLLQLIGSPRCAASVPELAGPRPHSF